MTDPSKAAMRAAKEICEISWDAVRTEGEHPLHGGNATSEGSTERIASIIDRETGVAELVEALDGLCTMITRGWIAPEFDAEELDDTPLDSGEIAAAGWDQACDAYRVSAAYKRARAALAKCKGE